MKKFFVIIGLVLIGMIGGDAVAGHGDQPTTHICNATIPTHCVINDNPNGVDSIAGRQWIDSRAGRDWIHGRGSDDQLYGGISADEIYGDADDDILRAGCPGGCNQIGENPDRLFGGTGHDDLGAANGKRDILDGGGGYDVCHTFFIGDPNRTLEDDITNCEEIILENTG